MRTNAVRKATVLAAALTVAAASGRGGGAAPVDDRLCPIPPETGLRGSWIWVPRSAGYADRNAYAYFRKTFRAGGDLTIRVAADNVYELYLDGALVDRGTAPSDTNYKTFDTYRKTIAPGRHVLAALVHHVGQQCATAMTSRPGLLVDAAASDGMRADSDASWRTLPVRAYRQDLPVMMSHFGFYEVADGAKVPDGWNRPGFDDSSWLAAEVVEPAGGALWPRLIPRDIPPLATTVVPARGTAGRGRWRPGLLPKTEPDVTPAVEMAARVREKDAAGREGFPVRLAAGVANECVVIDFGREVTGHLRLDLEGARAGQALDVGYDETLGANGWPNPRRTYVHFTDRYSLAEGQREVAVFGGRGFRYVLVDAAAGLGGVTITGARVEERTYPVAREGTFRSSDPELERLYRTGLLTTRLCMLDTFVDCPGRERVLWMDMAVEAQCALYGFGDTGLWRRCLFMFAQNVSRLPEVAGAVKGFVPCDYDPMLVSYTLYYAMSVCDYFAATGDAAACRALYPTVLKQLEVVGRFTTPAGLVNEKWPGWGTFLDWSAMDFGGVSSCNNAIWIRAHRKAARLAAALGMADDAKRLDRKTAELAGEYLRAFRPDPGGLVIDALYDGRDSGVRSQLASVMAVWAGIVTGEDARALLLKVMDPAALLPRTRGDLRLAKDFKPQTGGVVPIGTPGSGWLMVEALFENGLEDRGLAYLKANWGTLAPTGTYAEHFVADGNTSFCHGWGAGPVAQLPAYVLGVRPVGAGWREVEIAPRRCGLAWAEGTVPTPFGDVRVAWKVVDGKPKLTCTTPPEVKVVRSSLI